MARTIVWTKRASNKFNSIVEYLQKEWGFTVAENFVRKSFAIIDIIGEQPELGTMEDADKGIRGFLLTRHNRLFYRVTDDQIILINIFDTRSNPSQGRF